MKWVFLLSGLLFLPHSSCQQNQETEQIISFEAVRDGILRVFPEAYDDFLTVCFMQLDGVIVPDAATFMVPDKHVKRTLNEKELEKRAQLLMDQLELSPACQRIEVGEVEEYSWAEWEDKKVRKLTFYFGIGC